MQHLKDPHAQWHVGVAIETTSTIARNAGSIWATTNRCSGVTSFTKQGVMISTAKQVRLHVGWQTPQTPHLALCQPLFGYNCYSLLGNVS